MSLSLNFIIQMANNQDAAASICEFQSTLTDPVSAVYCQLQIFVQLPNRLVHGIMSCVPICMIFDMDCFGAIKIIVEMKARGRSIGRGWL